MTNKLIKSVLPLAFALFLISDTLLADDLNISGQNEARYGRGKPISGSSDDDYAFFENYLELNATLGDYRMYLRQTYLLPSVPELGGVRQAGLDAFDKWYIEYAPAGMNIRGGNFYRTWGRGLLFGTLESIDLGFDTGLQGVLVEGYNGGFEGAAYRGVEIDSVGDFREASEGLFMSYRLPDKLSKMDQLRIGGTLIRLEDGPRHPLIERSGVELEAEYGSGSIFAAYVADKVDFDPTAQYRNGFYSALTYYGSGVSVQFDYKNYNLFTYTDPTQGTGLADQPPLMYPTTVTPTTTMYLLDRHPRLQGFEDDVGWQLELTGIYADWSYLLNFNQSSRRENGNAMIPTLKEQYSPYQSAYFNLEWDDYETHHVVLQGGAHQDVEFIPTASGGYSEWRERIGFGSMYDYHFGGIYSVSADAQMLLDYDKGADLRFDDQYLALSISRSPDVSLTAAVERSNDPSEEGGTKDVSYTYWPSLELTYNFMQRHQVRLFGGYERGGLKCTGGVCRQVNPFNGVKVTLTSQF